jgi:hypothetical protein
MRKPWREPRLDDLLDDPVIEPLLRHDGVSKDDLRHLMAEARRRRWREREAVGIE